jgi:hypothetical protein
MMHLTQNDYEDSLDIRRKTPKNKSSEDVSLSAQYKMFVDALQEEMHRKYDLVSRQTVVNQDNQPHPMNLSPSLPMDKLK